MADQHNADIPAIGNTIAGDIPDIKENLEYHKDVLENFVNEWSNTTASGIFPAKTKRTALDNTDSPYTMLASDVIMECDCSAGALEIDLVSSATLGAGRLIFIKCIDATYPLTLNPNGAETIEGDSSLVVLETNQVLILYSDGTNFEIINNYKNPAYPKWYFERFYVWNNSGDTEHDISISAGSCRDYANSGNIDFTTSVTKQIDAAWAAGTNQGGMFTGSVAADTWYYLFVIRNPLDGSVDFGFDTDSTATNRPAAYTQYRRIFHILTDSSSNIKNFYFNVDSGWVQMDAPALDVDASQGTSETLRTIPVPPSTYCLLNCYVNRSLGADVTISSPDTTWAVPSKTAGPLASIISPNLHQVFVFTNGVSQIATRSSEASTTLRMSVIGYLDTRTSY